MYSYLILLVIIIVAYGIYKHRQQCGVKRKGDKKLKTEVRRRDVLTQMVRLKGNEQIKDVHISSDELSFSQRVRNDSSGSAVQYDFVLEEAVDNGHNQFSNKGNAFDQEYPSVDDYDVITDDECTALTNDEMNLYRSSYDENELIQEMRKHGILHGMFRFINENIERWRKHEVNIAVTGISGAGKSSLINALRRLKPTDQGAAKVGETETTFRAERYTFPYNNDVTLWDLPGAGTLNFPRETYLVDINYEQFDVFIIVFSTRVTENDIWFAQELMSRHKHVMFVRTKIDIDLENAKRNYPEAFSEEAKLTEIRTNIEAQLERRLLIMGNNVFLVSSRFLQFYDFLEMETRFKEILNNKGICIGKLIAVTVNREIDKKHMYTDKWLDLFKDILLVCRRKFLSFTIKS